MPNSKTGHYEVRDTQTRPGVEVVAIEWVSPTESRPLLMVTTTPERVPLLHAALGDYLKRRAGNGEHPDHLRPRIPPDDQLPGKRGPDGTPPS
jgi:hypothetical protein